MSQPSTGPVHPGLELLSVGTRSIQCPDFKSVLDEVKRVDHDLQELGQDNKKVDAA
jgi:hypothetical protein